MLSSQAKVHSRLTNKLTKRAFYNGAEITKVNRDFYSANSPFEQTAGSERDILRARARWLHENNPIIANIDDSFINNVIGTGITLQSITGDTNLDTEIEKRFKIWSKAVNCDIACISSFAEQQAQVFANRMTDGEIYIYKTVGKDRQLKLQLIEADALYMFSGGNGITYNDVGKPLSYQFEDKNRKVVTIPAENIINYFKKERPTQQRGISEYKQAIIDIKNFSAYQSSTVQNARANADIAYTVETDRDPHDFNVKSSDDEELHDINGLMVYYLKAGEKINKHQNTTGGSGYGDFISTTIRTIASARKISYELAFRDYSKVNFASSRASIIQDNKRFDSEQKHLTEHFLNDIFESWLEVEVFNGTLPISPTKWAENKNDFISVKWSYPKRFLVDPLKEVNALEKEIKLNLTTMTDACASVGGDFEEILMTKKKEAELMATYGILTPFEEGVALKEAGISNTGESE